MKLFDMIFTAMGMLLLGIAGWIGLNVAHIPSIETEIASMNHTIELNESETIKRIDDHEFRIRTLENRPSWMRGPTR